MNGDGDGDVTKKFQKLAVAEEAGCSAAPPTENNDLTKSEELAEVAPLNSDSESDSDSSSDASDIRAPLELLGEFISYVRQGNWEDAKKLCQMILIYEPENPEALQFLPMIEEKMQLMKELAEEAESVSSEEDEESTEEEEDEKATDDEEKDENEEESSDDEDRKEHLKNQLVFPHKDSETKIWRP